MSALCLRPSLLWLSLIVMVAAACGPTGQEPAPAQATRPAWPDDEPDLYNVKLAEGVVFATDEQVQKVRVEPNRLIFPASSVADVQAQFPMGKPVVGGPSTENVAQNPFGFMRKVTGVRTEGDSVIVDTEKAPLQDVVVGEFRATIDPDLAEEIILPPEVDLNQYFEEVDVGPGLSPPAFGGGQPLSFSDANRGPSSSVSQAINDNVSVTEAFSIPPITVDMMSVSARKTVGTGNRAVTVTIAGSGRLTSDFFFQPRLSLAFETSFTSGLDYFQAKAEGTYRSKTVLDVNVGVTAAAGTEPVRLVGLDELLREGPDVGRGPTIKLAESRPYRGPTIYGIPTTFRVKLYADCGWTIQGSMNVRSETNINTYLAAGIRYTDDDGWRTINDLDFSRTGTVQLTAGGGAAVECGISARVEWLVGDVGGPYLGIRAAAKAFGAYAESCNMDAPANGPSNGAATLKVNAGIEVQVGGSLDAWRVVRFEKGPYNLYSLNHEVWSRRYDFPGRGIGYCIVDCGNGTRSRQETDVDCGGPNCNDCPTGKGCVTGTDCVSGSCSINGVCVGGPCEDGVQNNGERNVDCGGPCGGCADGNVCERASECNSNVCSFYNVCVEGTWADQRLNAGESDVDCGSATPNPCAVGKRCNTPGDCASGACNPGAGTCVANSCQDGVRGPGEADVDCGGPCSPCGLGSTCLLGEDCVTGICNTVTSQCVASQCEDGIRSGMETDVDCGGECMQGCGEGGVCNAVEDCSDGLVCSARGLCAMPGCNDGLKNGAESSPDCGGGTCSVCSSGKTCNTAADCFSNMCGANGICVDTLCQDGVRNGTESDVDCGRDCGVYKCASGRACTADADCASGLCLDNRCVSDPCKDRLRNGTEGDVDCGGSCSVACATGRSCNVSADCASGVCNPVSRLCVASTCEDGVLTATTETDVDCGNACADCANGRRCAAASDCASGICNALTGRCAADTCSNGQRDGTETDVDCGGSCERKCLYQRACVTGGDCLSGTCVAGSNTCALDQCSDGRINGSESDVDCGGTCDLKCAVDKGCRTNADCQNPSMVAGEAGYCSPTSFTCLTTSCTSGVKDGDETGVDCGGSCGLCPVGQGCVQGSDCESTFCNATTRVCVATHCQDGTTNNGETDQDCGGTCTDNNSFPPTGPGKCQVNAVCSLPQDCQSGYCSSGRCVAPVPRSCTEIYNTGVRIDQAYTLDPDGPPWVENGRFGPQNRGINPPAPYYCDMTNGGWTNVWMLNSQYQNSGGFGYLGYGSQYSNGMHPRAASIQNSNRGTNIAPLANPVYGSDYDGMPWSFMRFSVYVQGTDFWTSRPIRYSQILLGWRTSGQFLANDCPVALPPSEENCNQPYDWCMGTTPWWTQGPNDVGYTNCTRRLFSNLWPMRNGDPGYDPDDLIAFGVQPNPWGGGAQYPSSPRGPFLYTFRGASRANLAAGTNPGMMYWTTPTTPNDGFRYLGPGGVNSRAHGEWGGVIAIWAR